MNCPNCGYPIYPMDGAPAGICPRCGQPLSTSVSQSPDTQPLFAPSAFTFAPPSPPPARAGHRRARLLIGLALALVVIAAGTGGAYLVSRNSLSSGPAAHTALTSATTTVAPNATPPPTSLPSPAATSATKLPASKATPTPRLVTLFADPLTSNKNGWPIDQPFCSVTPNGYYVADGAECDAPFSSPSNVNITVTVAQVYGSGATYYGIGFRIVHAQSQQYFFEITTGGIWRVRGPSGDLLPPQSSPALFTGQDAPNTLEVDCSGSQFTFSINGIRVGSVTNAAVASGNIGLEVEHDTQAVSSEAAFTNFKVTQWQ